MNHKRTNVKNKCIALMVDYILLEKQMRQINEKQTQLKADLIAAMDEQDIQAIDNKYLNITRITSNISASVNMKKVQLEAPKLYFELLKEYPKVTIHKDLLHIVVK